MDTSRGIVNVDVIKPFIPSVLHLIIQPFIDVWEVRDLSAGLFWHCC
jgi:hypothetical protein